MRYILDIKRFIDDGVGFFVGTEKEFAEWLRIVNQDRNTRFY